MSAGDLSFASLKERSPAMSLLFALAVHHGTTNSVMPLEHPSNVKPSLVEKFRVFAVETILAVMFKLHLYMGTAWDHEHRTHL